MRLASVAWIGIALFGCAESPRCVERMVGGRPTVVLECNAGEIAVCQPAQLTEGGLRVYDDETGALVPVSGDDGNCMGLANNLCRPRPMCGIAGSAPTCPAGSSVACVYGSETSARFPRDAGPPRDGGHPTADAGQPDQDAGQDAGDHDGG